MDLLRRALFGLVACAAACGFERVEALQPVDPQGPATREALAWPFASASIWNQPIGALAVYEPAAIEPWKLVGSDTSMFVTAGANAPERELFAPGPRPANPCAAGTPRLGMLRIPDDFVLSEGENRGYGNSTSVLQPDGRTLVEISGLARCTRGGPVFGFLFGREDLYGLGIRGGQGGSGLSALGGALRRGELTGPGRIRHALKISLWGERNLFIDRALPGNPPSGNASCFRWPADRCDGSARESYGGKNPKLVMGALLAIPPTVTRAQLALKTTPAIKLFEALQDYGAYVSGNAGTDGVLWGVERGALEEFASVFGYGLRAGDGATGDQAAWLDDVRRLVAALAIVDNNAQDSVGGGGQPRAPLAPPLPSP